MSEKSTSVATKSVTAGEEAQAATPATATNENTVDHQARCKAIITAEAAEGRKDLAHHLAFDTDMSVEQALGVLAKAPQQSATAEQGNALDAAMANTEQPNITAVAEDSEPSEAEQFVQSYKTATGAK